MTRQAELISKIGMVEVHPQLCADLYFYATKTEYTYATVMGRHGKAIVDRRFRNVETAELTTQLGPPFPWDVSEIRHALQTGAIVAASAIGIHVRECETPRVLRYQPGGYYREHNDSEVYKSGAWRPAYDRAATFIAFLNDDFTGGDLVFPGLGHTVKPQRGKAVVFPSDHRYAHKVEMVGSGTRYAVVVWMKGGGDAR